MNKIVGAVSSIVLAFYADAISLDEYKKHCTVIKTSDGGIHYESPLPASVDIIRGNALLASGILEKWRFYGDIKFSSRSERNDLPEEVRAQRDNGKACSLKDEAYSLKDEGASLNASLKYNPVTALLIQLFPSVGTNLNAQGAGALSGSGTNDKNDKKVKNQEIEIVNVIKAMFIIADDVRKNKGKSKIFDDIRQVEANKANANSGGLSGRAFINKYFGFRTGGNKFFNLAKNIANAVLLECEEDHFDSIKTDRYPPYFVNDLISAYAWAALPNAQLGELIEALKTLDDGSSKNQLADWMIKDTPISVVPFLPGEYVISTGKVFFEKDGKGYVVTDCVETMLRQFFCTLFCYRREDGVLAIDIERIPEKSILRQFFTDHGDDARAIANDGSDKMRFAWAKAVSGLKNALYWYDNCYELYPNWDNSIKVICALMDGYSAGDSPQKGESVEVWQRKKNAEKRINDVNAAVRDGTFNISTDETLNVINDLLGVRTDIKLVAKDGPIDIKKNRVFDVFPENNKDDISKNANTVHFVNGAAHAYVYMSAPIKPSNTGERVSSYWIEKLYNNAELAIQGDMAELYKGYGGVDMKLFVAMRHSEPLSTALYPNLEYYRRLSWDWKEPEKLEKQDKTQYNFGKNSKHLQDVAQLALKNYSSDRQPNPLPRTLAEKIQNEAYIEGIARLFYSGKWPLNEEITTRLKAHYIPLENQKKFYVFIAKNAESFPNAVKAVECLQQINASKELNELSEKTLSSSSSIVDIFIQRYLLGNYEKVDQVLVQKLRTLNDKMMINELIPLFNKVTDFYNKNKNLTIHPFGKDILDSMLPYIKLLTERLNSEKVDIVNTSSFVECIIQILAFTDSSLFDDSYIYDKLTAFIGAAKEKFPYSLITLDFLNVASPSNDVKRALLFQVCEQSHEYAKEKRRKINLF